MNVTNAPMICVSCANDLADIGTKQITALRQQRDELAEACKDLVAEVEDGVFAANIPSTIWAIFDDTVKPLLASIKRNSTEETK